ncbi:hypothetical protein GOBAR_DD30301 [Gossypium barbadense]|nr:hypothetical protein GOBAR_DD30301 [Gossypium barbadense]
MSASAAEALEYHSKDFKWDTLRQEIENDPSLNYHFLPFVYPQPEQQLSKDPIKAWQSFHIQHSSGKFFKERRYLLKEFPELVSCGDGCKVLEVGCGNGSSALPILRVLVVSREDQLLVDEIHERGKNEEYIVLDNKYIGDQQVEVKVAKDQNKGEALQYKIIFKMRLFWESDDAVKDPMFVQLSYFQLQHDYIVGYYPAGRDDAVQLSTLLILPEIGFVADSVKKSSRVERASIYAKRTAQTALLQQNKPTSSVEADTTGGSSLSSHAMPKLEVPHHLLDFPLHNYFKEANDWCSEQKDPGFFCAANSLCSDSFGGAIDKLVVNEPFEVVLNERKGCPLILFVTDIEKCRAGNIHRRLTTAKTDMGDLISMLNQEVAIFTLSAVPLQIMPTALRECFSVLKPGGMLLFRDYGLYDMTMLRFEPDQRVGFREYMRSDGTRSYFFCLDTVKNLFNCAGFIELEIEYCCVKSVNRRNGKSMQRVWVHGKFQKPT